MVIQVGEIYPSNNYGDMEVIEYVNSKKIKVRFIATGYERYTTSQYIRNGGIKDLFAPSVYGVGYIGDGLFKATNSGKINKVYNTWHDMLKRCYDPATQVRQPTYVGCSVNKEWHNFQVFATWFEEHYIDGYHLAKDIKVPGNKVYGPDTCTFVSQAKNNEAARSRKTIFRNPEGDPVEVYNITAFVKEHGLHRGHLSSVNRGERTQHKGWTLYKE